jgi:hypothetical protein
MQLDDLPLFRLTDPDTSQDGARDVQIRRGTQAAQLLEQYAQHRQGLTDEEAGVRSGLARRGAGYWKRCADLRRLGFIVDTGVRRELSTGSKGMVCVLTAKGLEWARQEAQND